MTGSDEGDEWLSGPIGLDKKRFLISFQNGEEGRNKPNCAPEKGRTIPRYIRKKLNQLTKTPFDITVNDKTVSFGMETGQNRQYHEWVKSMTLQL